MAIEVASAYVSLSGSADDLVKKLKKELSDGIGSAADSAGEEAGKSTSKSFMAHFTDGLKGIGGVVSSALKGAAIAGGAAAIGTGLFLKGAVNDASDLNETLSKTGVLFPELKDQAIAWADGAALSMGLSKTGALDAITAQANLLQAMGLTEQQAFDMGKALTERAVDLGSFMNASSEEAAQAVLSGLSGESEPLKRFGVFISEERLKAEALSMGLIQASVDTKKFSTAQEAAEKAGRKVAEAQAKYGEGSIQYSDAVRDAEQANTVLAEVLEGKVPASIDKAARSQALLSIFMKDSSAAAGDFLETQDSVANRQKQIGALWTDLSAQIGAIFLPVVASAMSFIVTKVFPVLTRWADAMKPVLESFGSRLLDVFRAAQPVLADVVGSFRALFAAFKSGSSDVTSSGMAGVFERIGIVARAVIDALIDVGRAVLGIDWAGAFGAAVEFLEPIAGAVVDIVKALVDLDWGAVFGEAVDFIRPVVEFLGRVGDAVGQMADVLREVDWQAVFDRAVELITPVVEGIVELKDAILDAATEALPPLVEAFDYLVTTVFPALSDVAGVVGPIVQDVFSVLADVVGVLGDHMDTLVPLLVAAGGAFAAFKVATTVADNVASLSGKLVDFTSIAGDGEKKAGSLGSSLDKIKDNFSNLGANAKGGIEGFKSSLSSLKDGLTGIGDKSKAGLSSLTSNMTKAKDATVAFASAQFTKLKAGLASIAGSAKAAGAAFLGYVKAVGIWIKQAVIATATAVKQAAVWVAQRVAMIATTVATSAMAAAQWLLNVAMNANPVLLIVTGLVALGAALVLAYRHSETFRNIVDAIGRFFRDVLWPAIVDIASAVGGFLVSAFGVAVEVFKVAFDVFSAIVGVIIDIATVVGTFLVDAFNTVWPIISGVADAIGTFLVAVIGFLIEKTTEAIPIIIDVGKQLIDWLAAGLDIVTAAAEKVWPVIQTVADWIGNVLKAQIDIARGAIDLLVEWFGKIISSAQAVYDGVKSWFDSMVSFLGGLGGRITSAVSGMFDGIKSAFRAAINFVIDAWNGLSFSLPGFDSGIPGVPSWGGVTISTPNVARLADGAVITEPTFALMGEVGRARPEIVTPERLMRQIVSEELANVSDRPIVVQTFIDGRQVAEAIAPHAVEMERSRR